MERVRALAMLAIETSKREPDAGTVETLRGIVARMSQHLAETKADARDTFLAEALGLYDHEVGFLWTVVAVSTDPRIGAHLVHLGLEHERAATLAFHARIEQLPGELATALGLSLGPSHPLVRHRLLIPTNPHAPAAGTWHAAHRTSAFLAGDDALDADLLGAGARVAVPRTELVLDDHTRSAHAQIERALGAGEVVVVVDGQLGVGRRTALALGASRADPASRSTSRMSPRAPRPSSARSRRWSAKLGSPAPSRWSPASTS